MPKDIKRYKLFLLLFLLLFQFLPLPCFSDSTLSPEIQLINEILLLSNQSDSQTLLLQQALTDLQNESSLSKSQLKQYKKLVEDSQNTIESLNQYIQKLQQDSNESIIELANLKQRQAALQKLTKELETSLLHSKQQLVIAWTITGISVIMTVVSWILYLLKG